MKVSGNWLRRRFLQALPRRPLRVLGRDPRQPDRLEEEARLLGDLRPERQVVLPVRAVVAPKDEVVEKAEELFDELLPGEVDADLLRGEGHLEKDPKQAVRLVEGVPEDAEVVQKDIRKVL